MSDSDERELELLLQQLKENADIDLRSHAAQQLGLKKNKSDIVVPALIEALNDDNWLVRVEVATALSKIGRAAAVAIEPLKSAMNEPRNRPKRGIFYEVIQTLETAKSAEPEVEPIAVVEEVKEEITFEEKVEEAAIVDETPIDPVIEPSEEVIEDVVEEPLVEEKAEVVTEEIVEEAIMEETLEDAVEDVLEDAIEDIVEDTVSEEVVEEIAEEIAEEVIELKPEEDEVTEVTEEQTVGEDITEIVEDVAEDITEDTTDEEIIEEAIEEIAEEVLEDVLEEEVGDTVDHEVIDDIAEEITEEVLEKEEEEEIKVEEPVETFQAPEVTQPHIEPEEEKKTTEDITEAVPLDEVLEFEEDKKKLEEQSPTVEPPTVEDIKTVRRSKALIKIVIVGDAAVGKTTLRKIYSDDSFSQESKHILGVDFAAKHFSKNNEDFALQIWDIAAKERFDKSKELFFKSIFGALLVFDVTNRESFNNIRYWIDELRKVESKELALVIVGNKTDLRSDQESTSITREEGQELASKLTEEIGFDVSYVETSAINGTGIEVAFRILEEKTTEQFFIDEKKME